MIIYSINLHFLCSVEIFLIIIYWNYGRVSSNQEFTIKIQDDDVITSVVLTQASNSYLANNNLPVWLTNDTITHSNNLNVYPELSNVMSMLGNVTSYHNYEKFAAFLHLSTCNCLTGVIDSRYVISRLPTSLIYQTHNIGNSHYVMRRRHLKSNKRPTVELKDDSILKQFINNYHRISPNHEAIGKEIYTEILVVITNDMYKSFDVANDDERVFYILNLMNAADMLYSTTRNPIVKLNIAGIIMENVENGLPFVSLKTNDNGEKVFVVNETVNNILQANFSYFEKSKLHSQLSFDYIFFLTSNLLSYDTHEDLKRMTAYPRNGILDAARKKECHFINPISIINDDSNYRSYPTIAHEIFHLINGGNYKETKFIEDHTIDFCKYRYMETYDKPSLEIFEWSNDCCLLTNKPQSLDFMQELMTLDKQCQCYNYKKHYKFQNSTCRDILVCLDQNDHLQHAAKILDDVACQIEWQTRRKQLLPSTTPIPTITPPPLIINNQSTWLNKKYLKPIVYIFKIRHYDNDLMCLGILIKNDEVITAKSCVNEEIQVETYIMIRPGVVVPEAQNIFKVKHKTTDIGDGLILLNLRTDVTKVPFNIESSYALNDIKDTLHDCILINMTKAEDSKENLTVQYISLNVTLKKTDEIDKFNLMSSTPVNKFAIMGNPLFCRATIAEEEKGVFVGLLVDDSTGYFKFSNLKDNARVA